MKTAAQIHQEIQKTRIIPVIALPSAEDALPLAEALAKGGLPCAEITFRTEAGRKGLANLAREFPDFLLGAGTVTSVEEVEQAADAGASFAVAPGLNRKVLAKAREVSLPFFPGIVTPTELETALDEGCSLMKFFPAGAAGGVSYLKALAAPYLHRQVSFIPTGGINPQNLTDYLGLPYVSAVGGSWLVAPLKEKNWKKITELTRAALQAVEDIDGARGG